MSPCKEYFLVATGDDHYVQNSRYFIPLDATIDWSKGLSIALRANLGRMGQFYNLFDGQNGENRAMQVMINQDNSYVWGTTQGEPSAALYRSLAGGDHEYLFSYEVGKFKVFRDGVLQKSPTNVPYDHTAMRDLRFSVAGDRNGGAQTHATTIDVSNVKVWNCVIGWDQRDNVGIDDLDSRPPR